MKILTKGFRRETLEDDTEATTKYWGNTSNGTR